MKLTPSQARSLYAAHSRRQAGQELRLLAAIQAATAPGTLKNGGRLFKEHADRLLAELEAD